MKKIFVILFLLAITNNVFSQEKTKSLILLKQEISNIPVQEVKSYQFKNTLEKKKAGLAIIYSFLLPGMGELYAGDYSFGQYLTIADGVFWGALFGFNIYGNRMEDNYKSFAVSNGGANVEGKDDKYFADLGNYLDIDQYNRRQKLDRNFIELYNDEAKYYWKWESQAERKEYRRMWKSSENAFNSVRFAAGALILNRIASVINAARLVSKHNKKVEEELTWNLSFGLQKKELLPTQLMMNFKTSF
jgi:hypothetical protein